MSKQAPVTSDVPTKPPECPTPVHRLVPFLYVEDVQASLAFYAHLGFHAAHVVNGPDGLLDWAWAQTREVVLGRGPAQIMFSRSSSPIVPTVQAVALYMHCPDVARLRAHLLASGVVDAGDFVSRDGPFDRRGVAFNIQHPPYMREGEVRVHDPDGYAVYVGQCDWRSPPRADSAQT